MPKWAIQILTPLVCGALLLLGVVALNSVLRAYFRDNQRCTIAFKDIDCQPPGNLAREAFLREVQYQGRWPDDINLLDDGLPARLHLLFAVHPWVESVKSVQIVSPRGVRVLLNYRTPVLALPLPDQHQDAWIPARDGKSKLPGRVVDGNGVLLQLAANDPRLPVLYGQVPPPTGQPGQPWGDPSVVAAAGVAASLLTYQEQFNLKDFEIVDGVLVLSNERTRVLWGPVAGDQTPHESRLQSLLDLAAKHKGLAGLQIDVRLPDHAVVRPL